MYFGSASDAGNSSAKTGVLLVNLGTPDTPNCPGLRRYLSEFLMDPRVIEIPKLFRWLLVKGIIINFRSHKSARTYREIWTDQGSPLLINSQNLSDKVANRLGDDFCVRLGMRYGNPSIDQQLKDLQQQGVRKLIILPLYPQYSGSTAGSVFDAVSKSLSKFRWTPSLSFIDNYHLNSEYLDAVANSIQQHWQQHGQAKQLLMSFHGVPKKFIDKGDPYQAQCIASAEEIAKRLGLQSDQWQLVFQSRFGAEEWIKPYCDKTLEALPKQGVDNVDMVCPGFSADCLETLEEIAGENREYFEEAGGKQYSYIPCLNDSDDHVNMVATLIKQQII